MKILFCGGFSTNGMSGWQRLQTLKELGHLLIPFSQEAYLAEAIRSRLVRFVSGAPYRHTIVEMFNQRLLQAVQAARPEVVWVEWPMLVLRETIERAKSTLSSTRWISFQDDNPFGLRREEKPRWQFFVQAIPVYDLHLVKRKADVDEYRRRGATQVELFMHGFYEPLFRPACPAQNSAPFRYDVSCVATALDHRVPCVGSLLGKHRIPVQVFGNKWNRAWCYYRHRTHFHRPVFGQHYVEVIWQSRISLAFVSSSNRDEYTMRTFEIPACAGFLLAERTPAHQQLFVEGKEAEFFSSTEECADKVQFYLKAESERNKIAEQGYRRCLKSDYSLHRRMREAIAQVQLLPCKVPALKPTEPLCESVAPTRAFPRGF
jgi:hypothetical protein